MPKNRLTIHGLTITPSHLPSSGGNLNVKFHAKTNQEDAKMTVEYSIGSGPYRVSSGGNGSHNVKTSSKTYRDRITVSKGPGTAVSFRLKLTANVPGDSPQSLSRIVWIDEPFSKIVKAFRESHELSQRDLAEKAGLSQSTISAAERKLGVSFQTQFAIAEVIDNE